MLATLNERLFLALNAPSHPDALTVGVAEVTASWLVYAAVALVVAVGSRTPDARGALLATILGVVLALGLERESWFRKAVPAF